MRRGREIDFAISLGGADHQGFGFDKEFEVLGNLGCEGLALLDRERVSLSASSRSDLIDSAATLRKKDAALPCVETSQVAPGNASAQLLDEVGYFRRGTLMNSANDPENLGIGRFDTDVATIRTADLAVGNRPEFCCTRGYAVKAAQQIGNEADGMPNIADAAKALGSQASDSVNGRAEGNLFFVSEHANGSFRR